MSHEIVLGYYHQNGRTYIGLDVVEDTSRMLVVNNHESTHFALGSHTSYGLLQRLVATHGDTPWIGAAADQSDLAGLLHEHAWLVQESTATFCGFALEVPDPAIRHSLRADLPARYVSALALLEDFFDGSALSAQEKYAAARLLGMYAMDSTILLDWIELELRDPLNLRRYLAKPGNSPDGRFRILLSRMDASTLNTLGDLAKYYSSVGETPTSASDSFPIAGLRYSRLSIESTKDGVLLPIHLSIRPTPPPHLDSEWRVVLLGRPALYRTHSAHSFDFEAVADCDLVFISVNPHRRALDTPLYSLPPLHGRLAFTNFDRSTYECAIVALDDLPPFLASADPHSRMTLELFTSMALHPTRSVTWTAQEDLGRLPYRIDVNNSRLMRHHGDGVRGGRTALYMTDGDIGDLSILLSVFNGAYGALVATVRVGGPNWGIVVIRPSIAAGVAIVHPVILWHWKHWEPQVCEWYDVTIENQSNVFFAPQDELATAVARQMRSFKSAVYTQRQWNQILTTALEGTTMDDGNVALLRSEDHMQAYEWLAES